MPGRLTSMTLALTIIQRSLLVVTAADVTLVLFCAVDPLKRPAGRSSTRVNL